MQLPDMRTKLRHIIVQKQILSVMHGITCFCGQFHTCSPLIGANFAFSKISVSCNMLRIGCLIKMQYRGIYKWQY